MRALLHLVIVLIFAGLAHLVSLLLLPLSSERDVFTRVLRLIGTDGVSLIPAAIAEQFAFADSYIALGACRYDLSAGPMRIRTRVSPTFLALVFAEDRRGIFSSVSDRAATHGVLEIVLATPAQLSRIADLDDPNEAVEEIRIEAPSPRGLVLIKVVVDRPSGREIAQTVIQNTRCEIEFLPS